MREPCDSRKTGLACLQVAKRNYKEVQCHETRYLVPRLK
jgi:hypothetical protein